jgi:dTDP-4-amino-4,6-dideoxygalactose transaminase
MFRKRFILMGIFQRGPNLTGFETDLENYLGQNCFVGALNSGTAVIHLGLIL